MLIIVWISVSRNAVLTHRFIPLRLRKKISLYDKQLQGVLDGIPPEDAQRLKLKTRRSTKVWQIGDELYVRSNMQLQDEFEKRFPLSMAHMFTCCRQHQY